MAAENSSLFTFGAKGISSKEFGNSSFLYMLLRFCWLWGNGWWPTIVHSLEDIRLHLDSIYFNACCRGLGWELHDCEVRPNLMYSEVNHHIITPIWVHSTNCSTVRLVSALLGLQVLVYIPPQITINIYTSQNKKALRSALQ